MLQAKSLCKEYNGHQALKNLNLKINAGEIYCLLGANGAGKSTTINLFLDFIKPTSGEALVNGLNAKDYPIETKQALAYIPEIVNQDLMTQARGMSTLEADWGYRAGNDLWAKIPAFDYDPPGLGAILSRIVMPLTLLLAWLAGSIALLVFTAKRARVEV